MPNVHDPADVVAGEVDEHHVLGELLGVLAQLGAEAAVLLVGATPAAGAGDRPGDDPAVEQLHHRLGRRADERQLGVRTKYMYGLGLTWRSTR